ncbi:ABC transporter substrate-binding protein [Acuticoccus sp. I52.16.1]|uniref:ABC transporter substrate-binding protein n=1 Tax=Acuticoccus sp. I52.16.1 TaxID=2928472 RepID=UPI001FD152CD|nr:ABC transporter substrate-binding protein [Acuticoccus sp. I52.16.1]UOM32906.1 ABC transporter substrate-binding protein [Acuticoccus sp. I52.16.1]
MLTRRKALALGAGLLATPYVTRARAQSPYRIAQILYRGQTEVEAGFSDYLAQRGVPVDLIEFNANLDPSRVPDIVKEVKALKPDLVYSWGTPNTIATFGRYDDVDPDKNITELPGVFTMVSAPVASGLVPTRESSGRNITGTSHVVPAEPQLRAMQTYKPFERLGVLYTSNEPNSLAIVANVKELGDEMGFTVVERTFPLGADGKPDGTAAKRLVEELAGEGAQWLYYLPDTFLSRQMADVTPTATALGVPGFSAAEAMQGDALVSLISRYYSVGQLTGYKAEQILVDGIAPAAIPIETLKRFALVINMKMARELALYPPLAMLNYANILRDE